MAHRSAARDGSAIDQTLHHLGIACTLDFDLSERGADLAVL
jgi:hypothetical protein